MPVVHLTKSVADTSELFLRSIQMYNLFSSTPSPVISVADDSMESVEPEGPLEMVTTPPATKIKIGALVRNEIEKLILSKLLTPEKVHNLCNEKFSKETFGINYPLLKKISHDKPVIDQRLINGYPRYWSKVYIINGERYLLCNDWYERNTLKFKLWVKQFY